MTELDAHLLQASIDECNKIRHGIQEAILKCFPIGSKARAKISGDVVTKPRMCCSARTRWRVARSLLVEFGADQ